MSVPSVSVILPTYNAADHVVESVESLCTQTLDDFEVVVIDDGSTDGTRSLVREYGDDRFRLVKREQATGGLPGALNRGIRESVAPYIARHDADDRSHPERLAAQVSFLEGAPEVALIGSSVRLIRPDGSVKDVRRVKPAPTFDDLIKKNRFVHGAVTFRREVAEKIGGYDEAFEFSEDYDLWLRIASDHSVRNLDVIRYDLRIHDESIYASELEKVKLYAAFARKRVLNDTDLSAADIRKNVRAIYATFDSNERARFHREMAQALLRYGEHSSAREHVKKGLRNKPSDAKVWGFLALSAMPPRVVNAAIWITRRILNARP